MAFAITQTCCHDATCVTVCPVNCIRPTPQERDFGSTEMLHIDPQACIDCGACADACPVDAIFPVPQLPSELREYAARNAAYFEDQRSRDSAAAPTACPSGLPAEAARPEGPNAPDDSPPDRGPNFHPWSPPVFDRTLPADFGPLRVAVVGTGPAGMYAAQDLLLHTNAEVTLIDRLPVSGGLLRYGVAPDHPSTKKIGETFARFHDHPRTRLHLGLEVGEDVSVRELADHHDAVIYAVGAGDDRRLGIPGEDLPGSLAATRFVSWYNAHPDVPPDTGAASLESERVVLVGNGNVALDVARILMSDPDALARTDLAAHALEALRSSKVREVVLLGRRGPEHAAYTVSEAHGLTQLPDVELVVDDHDPRIGESIDAADGTSRAGVLRSFSRRRMDWSAPPAPGRRIVFRFHSAPLAALGEDGAAGGVRAVRVTGVAGDGSPTQLDLPAGALLRAVGSRGRPLAGLPFDQNTGTVPHEAGRVAGQPGAYVVGWYKRGPSGGIGANRGCAAETVGTLLADAVAGRLPAPQRDAKAFRRLVRRRNRRVVDARGLAAIHRAELARGAGAGRPRQKLATVEELLAAARTHRFSPRR